MMQVIQTNSMKFMQVQMILVLLLVADILEVAKHFILLPYQRPEIHILSRLKRQVMGT